MKMQAFDSSIGAGDAGDAGGAGEVCSRNI